MITIKNGGTFLVGGQQLVEAGPGAESAIAAAVSTAGLPPAVGEDLRPERAAMRTMTWPILTAHSKAREAKALAITFDALASHDITYVGIVQNVRACGLKRFPVPYALTNCHNSLCAVGGTINEDDHAFGLSAAELYGGIFVPAHYAVIHQFVREALAGCGKMILGSDSHTRYGALGTMGIGEGGPEIAKQLLSETYDLQRPPTVCVYLSGAPRRGVGPHDVALALIRTLFRDGVVKNCVMEFVGPGIASLPIDFRNGIDVMTTEMAALSSIWVTDERVQEFYRVHGRPDAYRPLAPGAVAYYDRAVVVELDKVEPMIGLPFHPSNAYPIREFLANAGDILRGIEAEGKKLMRHNAESIDLHAKLDGRRFSVDQAIIAGCAGGLYDNIMESLAIVETAGAAYNPLPLSIYPGSLPIFQALSANGALARLMAAGAVVKTAFCGPCFGAGDTPQNNGFSIRHTTRNFENREGSKPGEGQLSFAALMDARSIAATYANGGRLRAADEVDYAVTGPAYTYDGSAYRLRVYDGTAKPKPGAALRFGPNIADWPEMPEMPEHLLLCVASVLTDPVTTTDELIPSGETSSYRSNPYRLAEFTLSRKDPGYVGRAKAAQELEKAREAAKAASEIQDALAAFAAAGAIGRNAAAEVLKASRIGSVVVAVKPGDGSAREQAASCQKVLGGWANLAREYATARYRSNLINWGILPFIAPAGTPEARVGAWVLLPGIRQALAGGAELVRAFILTGGQVHEATFELPGLTSAQRAFLLEGCQINYYRKCRRRA